MQDVFCPIYQTSSAVLGWVGDRDCYLMHKKCSQVANLIEMTVEVYQKLVSLHDKKMEQSLFVMYSAHQFNETGVITHTEVQ